MIVFSKVVHSILLLMSSLVARIQPLLFDVSDKCIKECTV